MREWKKFNVYVVYAYYDDDNYEEEVCDTFSEAEKIKKMYDSDSDFCDVVIEGEIREFLCEVEGSVDND